MHTTLKEAITTIKTILIQYSAHTYENTTWYSTVYTFILTATTEELPMLIPEQISLYTLLHSCPNRAMHNDLTD